MRCDRIEIAGPDWTEVDGAELGGTALDGTGCDKMRQVFAGLVSTKREGM